MDDPVKALLDAIYLLAAEVANLTQTLREINEDSECCEVSNIVMLQ